MHPPTAATSAGVYAPSGTGPVATRFTTAAMRSDGALAWLVLLVMRVVPWPCTAASSRSLAAVAEPDDRLTGGFGAAALTTLGADLTARQLAAVSDEAGGAPSSSLRTSRDPLRFR